MLTRTAIQGGTSLLLAAGARASSSNTARRRGLQPVRAAKEKQSDKTETATASGIVFNAFEEVAPVLHTTATQGELNSPEPKHSFARHHTYDQKLEAAVNEQINVELNMSYVYMAMASYFDRDNVALHGFAHYYREQSLEERGHAQKLIDFQNLRGGRVKFISLLGPEPDFNHPEKGDALYSSEVALSLEKLNLDKLLQLWEVCDKHGDAQATHFLEDMLDEQVKDIKTAADHVAQLRRLGKGHGVWDFDHELYEREVLTSVTA